MRGVYAPRMQRIALILVAAALAACSQGSTTTTTPTTAGPTCASAGSNVGTLLQADLGDRMSAAQHTELVAAVEQHCANDGWSSEAIACVSTAATGEELEDRCESTLTEAQVEAVDDDYARIIDGRQDNDDV